MAEDYIYDPRTLSPTVAGIAAGSVGAVAATLISLPVDSPNDTVANPLTVIEQISFLMFARLLDMRESTEEKKWSRKHKGKPFPGVYFPRNKQRLRWSQLKQDVSSVRSISITHSSHFSRGDTTPSNRHHH